MKFANFFRRHRNYRSNELVSQNIFSSFAGSRGNIHVKADAIAIKYQKWTRLLRDRKWNIALTANHFIYTLPSIFLRQKGACKRLRRDLNSDCAGEP